MNSDPTDFIIDRIFAPENDAVADVRLIVQALLSITERLRELEAQVARVEWFV